jgi:GTP-binding protein HflX
VELDRRKIRDRISELKAELAAIEDESKTRRARRQEVLHVALVGYTNAGESSLMRALTGSQVLVADKLFATLDTTVRALWPESRPRILVSDTVGSSRSSRATSSLASAPRSTRRSKRHCCCRSSMRPTLSSAPRCRSHARCGKRSAPATCRGILVLNKIDQVAQTEREELLKEFAAQLVSAKDPADVREAIIGAFEANMTEVDLVVSYDGGQRDRRGPQGPRDLGVLRRGRRALPSQGPGVRDRADTGDAALECAAVPRGGTWRRSGS